MIPLEELIKFSRAVTRRVHRNRVDVGNLILSVKYQGTHWQTRSHFNIGPETVFKTQAKEYDSVAHLDFIEGEELKLSIPFKDIEGIQFWEVKNEIVQGLIFEYVADNKGIFTGTRYRIYPNREDTPVFRK